ncbi:MAG: DUF4266 domain-containing protein [Gammaproteobacteria bacterium]
MHGFIFGFCISTVLLLAACTPTIHPWERGALAKPHMAAETNPLKASLHQHIQVSKEASSGGLGLSGGGCGCN